MAPHPRFTDLSSIGSWTLSATSGDFFKILLFISIAATAFKTYAVLSLRRKKRMVLQISFEEKDVQIPCQEKETKSCQHLEQQAARPSKLEDPYQQLHALRQELSQPALKPVYPWIAPPTPLPGPYDAPYYPLPNIRRHSQGLSCGIPEQTQTVPYIRRGSTNTQELILHGTTTVSNHGWRRTQWTVATG